MEKEQFNNEGELSQEIVRENIILAEKGEELTEPLAILNEFSNFKKEWKKIQEKIYKKEYNERIKS
jgi:hypothetical protein